MRWGHAGGQEKTSVPGHRDLPCLGTTVLLPTRYTLLSSHLENPGFRLLYFHTNTFPLRPKTALHKAPSLPSCTPVDGLFGPFNFQEY